uniref:rRNA N-glycosylase n=1 Tax=Cannabis sativa TaxID=3483 RepID=A0A803QLR1_CANSA
MGVEFEVVFNLDTATRTLYRNLIADLRRRLSERITHGRPTLPLQAEPPTRFFDLVLQTSDHSVRFRFRIDNLYLIGYQMETGEWLEFQNDSNPLTHFIPNSTFLNFNGSYRSLAKASKRNTRETRVGFYNIGISTNRLATSTVGEVRAACLVVVIIMISESIRLLPVQDYVSDQNFENRPRIPPVDYIRGGNADREGLVEEWLLSLIRNWGSLSEAVFQSDNNPETPLPVLRTNEIRIPPNNSEIRMIAHIIEIMGILLRFCIDKQSGPGPRDGGKCFVEGVPLLEVFSVRIDNIDGEDPGELYGTIIADDGLNTQHIYNRTRSRPETVRPYGNAALTGPGEAILATGSVNIKLLLTDKDIISPDDEIVNGEISWDYYTNTNKYDKLISEKVGGKYGGATVNYAVLRNAVAARITINLEEKQASGKVLLHGRVSAFYGGQNWDMLSNVAESLLFSKSKDEYVYELPWQDMKLMRSVVAVPMENSLKIKATLYDYDSSCEDLRCHGRPQDLVIADGTVNFPAQTSGTSSNYINGQQGNRVKVTVSWSSGIFE